MHGFEFLWVVFVIVAAEIGRFWQPFPLTKATQVVNRHPINEVAIRRNRGARRPTAPSPMELSHRRPFDR
jgi:hypothetical protein